ncbi:DUF2497 domain-containing protein [Siculibacillus lacustris]|uniref:DUF2497 domain-containing protein n=1 Tax=Siculibacillus lacustris TaxID=1549641 RepID=A0A4Q9VQY1_9HYPH|nr:DUF2497 domain-containing protein [Siculibacillus lacustris]TBW37981.1 DUF2497 domain-containing protein [Siculibacillus lacustris]
MAKAQAQEPSMEEILASIRRIIADEEATPKTAAAKAPPPAEAPEPAIDPDEIISEDDLDKLFASAGKDEPEEIAPAIEEVEEDEADDDVLELTEDLAEDDSPLVEGFSDDSDLAFAAPAPPPPPKVEPPVAAPVAAPAFVAPPPVAAAPPPPAPVYVAPPRPAEPVVDGPRLLSDVTDRVVSSAFNDLALTVLNRNARTLEDLVQDMLRPMLQGWLDQNLPLMVERLVKAEIERVTRGR